MMNILDTVPLKPPIWHQVLLIDDDPINNLICEELLRVSRFAAETRSFLRARLALEWLSSQTVLPARIFLDINMPEMSGWDFLEALAELPACRHVPVSILSSSPIALDRNRAKTYSQVDSYLLKPLMLKHLQALEAQVALV